MKRYSALKITVEFEKYMINEQFVEHEIGILD